MSNSDGFPAEGKCACGSVEYRLTQPPMIVHCCHCTWCQRESGSAFAVNALIESDSVELLKGSTETIAVPSNSGAGQNVVRCSTCKSALWSHYGAAREKVAFVRVGTLNNPNLCPPDIHIYTTTKQHWVVLPEHATVVDEYYRRSSYWPEASVVRYKKATEA
ncbi:GFA family protein [Marinobacter zhejiangensis]|uniref:Uncharacterized conserved protein n=1 Tax=Marinobacter zhejiangensis TaxID=488535 RepID=A0A1I4T3E9_9GAMM|nr:GFA family protein [Marinobacter zhejiangensis]SFM71133.1 Uncharacterized conserved protein [Marinobacter zhejiangensis]